jgi:opacity protein-like surface antigen
VQDFMIAGCGRVWNVACQRYAHMKRTALLACICTLIPPTGAAGQVVAEPLVRAGTWTLTVEVGGAAFSDLERTRARPISGDLELGDFSRRVSARTAGSAGGWVGYWITDGWGVRAGMSYVPTSFTVWNDETARRALDAVGAWEDDPSYASLDLWMADATVVFQFPRRFGRVTPYGLVGGGLVRYDASDDAVMPPEARSRFADGIWQGGAAVFGVGAAIPLQRSDLLMSFELTNHLSRTPLGGRSAGEFFELGGVSMQIDPDAATSQENEVGLTSHVRLAVGLTLPLR